MQQELPGMECDREKTLWSWAGTWQRRELRLAGGSAKEFLKVSADVVQGCCSCRMSLRPGRPTSRVQSEDNLKEK